MSQPVAYSRVAVALHWLVALLFVVIFSIGLYVMTLTGPARGGPIFIHKALASTFLVLVVLRLVWRLFNPPPALPAGMSPMLKGMAHAGHWLLYALMIIVPLNGWLASSAFGYPVMLAGVVQLPMLLAKDPDLGKVIMGLHQPLSYLFGVVVVGHMIMATWHHYVARDCSMTRMSLRGTR